MAMKINENCMECAACEDECPQGAISEGDGIYIIDPNTCNECEDQDGGPQCVEACPADAVEKA
mgnify:CR=1 FL=1